MRGRAWSVGPSLVLGWSVWAGCGPGPEGDDRFDGSDDPTSPSPADPDATGEDDWPADWAEREREVVRLVNQLRARGTTCGGSPMLAVGPLESDDILRTAARGHSEDMARRGFFDHFSPEGDGPDDRIRDAGFSGAQPWGENVAAAMSSAQDAVDAWENSPGHCRNMMSGDYAVIGVGYYAREDDPQGLVHYWTQNFAGSH